LPGTSGETVMENLRPFVQRKPRLFERISEWNCRSRKTLENYIRGGVLMRLLLLNFVSHSRVDCTHDAQCNSFDGSERSQQ
jgi:hypothetical protein